MSFKRVVAGPDPAFPYVSEQERFSFPDPRTAKDGIVAMGGNLSPGMLLSAYEQGIFPWFNPGEPVIWHSPDPRFVLFPENLHISASMRKTLRQNIFEVRFDADFPAVIRACAAAKRPHQNGTWISEDMMAAYTELHRLKIAHSSESYLDGELCGGCYGLLLGSVFFGESMFARKSNASKAAFLTLAQKLFSLGVTMIDCQVPTEHLHNLGAKEIPRTGFLRLLETALQTETPNLIA